MNLITNSDNFELREACIEMLTDILHKDTDKYDDPFHLDIDEYFDMKLAEFESAEKQGFS
jgi:hypothetical protein